jgi:periplasmic protein TonB
VSNSTIFTREKHLYALLWMFIGGMAILSFSLMMNSFSSIPEKKPKLKTTSFAVQKVVKKQPKKKPKPKKSKKKSTKSARTVTPNLGSNLSGLDMQLDLDMGMGETDDSLLGDTSNVVMSAESVDTLPKAYERSAMEYPKSALKDKVSGYVLLNMLIDTKGAIEQVKILESEPKGVFDDAAREGIESWKFEAAIYQGKKVRVWAKQKISFNLD